MPLRDFLFLVAICAIWAANIVISKIAIGVYGAPPMLYAALRSGIVALVLVGWLRTVPRPLWQTLLVTLLIGSGAFVLQLAGLRTASASAAAVVTLLGPPITVGFAIVLLGERIGWRRGIGIALTLIGVAIVMGKPAEVGSSFGLILIALSTALGALGAVLLKRVDATPMQLQAWGGVSGLLLILPLGMAVEHAPFDTFAAGGWVVVAALFYSALVSSIIGHTGYYWLLQRHDANLIAPLTLMTPLFTIAMGVAFAGERIDVRLVIGGLLAMAGVLVIVVRPSRTIPKWLLGWTRE